MGVAWVEPVESAHAGLYPEKGPYRLRLFALTVEGAPKTTVLRGWAEHRSVTVAHFDTSNADALRERLATAADMVRCRPLCGARALT